MMGYMKWLLSIGLGALGALFTISGAHAQVFGVKTVYLLPMAGGLDQYLALQLTSGGVLQVVTDPKKADAILTDGIGARTSSTKPTNSIASGSRSECRGGGSDPTITSRARGSSLRMRGKTSRRNHSSASTLGRCRKLP